MLPHRAAATRGSDAAVQAAGLSPSHAAHTLVGRRVEPLLQALSHAGRYKAI